MSDEQGYEATEKREFVWPRYLLQFDNNGRKLLFLVLWDTIYRDGVMKSEMNYMHRTMEKSLWRADGDMEKVNMSMDDKWSMRVNETIEETETRLQALWMRSMRVVCGIIIMNRVINKNVRKVWQFIYY